MKSIELVNISTLATVIGIAIIFIKTILKLFTKSKIEKVLTPKHIVLWEELSTTFIFSIALTAGLMILAFTNGENVSVLLKSNFISSVFLVIRIFLSISFLFVLLPAILLKDMKETKMNKWLWVIWNKIKLKIGNIMKKCSIFLKQIIKVTFILTYICIVYYYLISAIDIFASDYNMLFIILYIGISSLFFVLFFAIMRWVFNSFKIWNVDTDIYKVTKVDSSQLSDLYFGFVINAKIYVFSSARNTFSSQNQLETLNQVYVYHVDDDVLLKYSFYNN